MTGMLLDELGELRSRTTIRQGATGIQVRYQHFLIRAEDFRCFSHKVNPTKHDDIRLRLSRPLCQGQTVSHIVRYILYIACLIVMRQNNRILLFT